MLLEAEDAAFVAMVAADNNAPGESAAHSANARSNDIHQGTMKIESNMQSCSPKNILSEENKTSAMISHIKERIDSVSKASSPSLWLSINDVQTNSVVDEGSELVVMDFEFAKKANIPIEKSSQTAKAADGGAMSIVGQSKYPLQVQVLGCRVPISRSQSLLERLPSSTTLAVLSSLANQLKSPTKLSLFLTNTSSH